jgi:hypothetical protein
MAMMAMTTNSSINVKATRPRGGRRTAPRRKLVPARCLDRVKPIQLEA